MGLSDVKKIEKIIDSLWFYIIFIVMIGVSLNSSLSYSRVEKDSKNSKDLITALKDIIH